MMMTPMSRSAILLTLVAVAGAASAQNYQAWDGIYAGVNAGSASNTTCNSWTPTGATIDPAIATALYDQTCAGGGKLVAGVQIGDNFQHKRFVWGIGADLDIWNSKTSNASLTYTGAAPPAGSYASSGKLSPSDFLIIGPRIGYAGDQWMPYLRVGGVITSGSHDSTLSFTPTGAAKPTVSFGGGNNYSSSGWAGGGGAEIGLHGAWSISAEDLHVDLGKGSTTAATCSGTAAACAGFAGIAFDSMHSSFTANIVRISINYWFGYWGS